MIITIDGPTASGKSTLACDIAKKLGLYYLNSGLLYRGIAYILFNYFDYDEERLKNPHTKDLESILSSLLYSYDGDNAYLSYEGQDITPILKTAHVDRLTSIVSPNREVRAAVTRFQRKVASEHDSIMDGRDCGSVVFPNADLKIFLTADLEIRAVRWQSYMASKNKIFTLADSIQIISDRDRRDKEREISPLIVPDGAHIIESSHLEESEVLEQVLSLINSVKS